MGFVFGGLYTWTKNAKPEVKVVTFYEMNALGTCDRAYWYGRICSVLNITTVAILAVSAVLILSSPCFNPLSVGNLKLTATLLVISELLGIVAWPMAISMYKNPLCSAPMTEPAYAVYTPEIALPDQPNPSWSISAMILIMVLEWIIMLVMTVFLVAATRDEPGLLQCCSRPWAKWKKQREKKRANDDGLSVPISTQTQSPSQSNPLNSDFL